MLPDQPVLPKLIPTVERLEYVRKGLGYKTLRDFWRALTEEGEYEISYPALRTWHLERDAPAHYLARVAKVFGVRPTWLLLGEGQAFELEEQVREAQERVAEIDAMAMAMDRVGIEIAAQVQREQEEALETLEATAPYVLQLPRGTRQQFIETAGDLAATHPFEEQNLSVAVIAVAKLVLEPFKFLPFTPAALERQPLVQPYPAFRRYVAAMLVAIDLAAVVEPDLGDAEDG